MKSKSKKAKEMKVETVEFTIIRKNKINKTVIGAFLAVVIATILMKLVDGALQDFGYGVDELMGNKSGHTFHSSFWLHNNVVQMAMSPGNPALRSMVLHHPNFLWLFTQFTWITTIIILMFLIFRMFKFDSVLPRWLKWIMTQRTLSLIVMYDMIVAVVFWSSMFSSFENAFIPKLKALELTLTIFVHAFIPFFIMVYSMIFLVKDSEASALRELFVLKGMIYPTIYMFYYLLIALIWQDPYGITDLHNNFVGDYWKLIVALLAVWIMLGIMLLMHNFILNRFNKTYDPKNDSEIIKRREEKIQSIKNKARRRAIRDLKHQASIKAQKKRIKIRNKK